MSLHPVRRAARRCVDPERPEPVGAFERELAVDDLGEGYAGLAAFIRLNPEYAKIDMSLVRELEDRVIGEVRAQGYSL